MIQTDPIRQLGVLRKGSKTTVGNKNGRHLKFKGYFSKSERNYPIYTKGVYGSQISLPINIKVTGRQFHSALSKLLSWSKKVVKFRVVQEFNKVPRQEWRCQQEWGLAACHVCLQNVSRWGYIPEVTNSKRNIRFKSKMDGLFQQYRKIYKRQCVLQIYCNSMKEYWLAMTPGRVHRCPWLYIQNSFYILFKWDAPIGRPLRYVAGLY